MIGHGFYVLLLAMRWVALCSGMMALVFRNDGSHSPDWWLKVVRNNHRKSCLIVFNYYEPIKRI